jgi:hypothetical protein
MMTATVTHFRENRKAVRLLWPFVRILGQTPAAERLLANEGIGPADLARPDTRLSHRLVMDLLDAWIACTGDATIGLRAGQSVEPGELETMEYAARSCPTFREAIHCSARYMHLLNEAADVSLIEQGDVALWRFTVSDGVRQSRAANDFVLVCAGKFSRRYARVAEPPLEVHFMHDAPEDTSCYEKFRSKLKFGMPHNGFVFARSLLDRPMVRAHAGEVPARSRAQHQRDRVQARLCARPGIPQGVPAMDRRDPLGASHAHLGVSDGGTHARRRRALSQALRRRGCAPPGWRHSRDAQPRGGLDALLRYN